MKPTIVFDFDGTLADSRSIFLTIFNQLAAKHHYSAINEETIDHLRTLSIPQRCRYLKVPFYKIPFLAAEFLSIYRHHTSDVPVYEGIAEMLEKLHTKGYHLAIISSNEEEIIRSFLERNHLTMIDEVYASKNLFGKHHVLKRFMKKQQLKSSDILYVGDELRDIKACQAVGIPIIWVDWGYDVASLVEPLCPTYTAQTPDQIDLLVNKHFTYQKGV